MNLSLGIDIGSFSTKAAALDEHGTLLGTLQVHADDPRTSAYGVLGRFLDQQGASFDDVEKIVLTGLGSTYFHENIFGIPTIHALELDAIGHGGLYLSGLDEALVVSLGTGSAFIRASRTNGFRHLGGSGVGGGTLAGMAERFLVMVDKGIAPTQPPPKAASVHNICDPACEKNLLLIKRRTMETPDPQMSGIPEPVCRSPQCGLPSSPGVLNI